MLAYSYILGVNLFSNNIQGKKTMKNENYLFQLLVPEFLEALKNNLIRDIRLAVFGIHI